MLQRLALCNLLDPVPLSCRPILCDCVLPVVFFYLCFSEWQPLANFAANRSCQCTEDETDRSSARSGGTAFRSTLAEFPRLCVSLLGRHCLGLRCGLIGVLSSLCSQLINLLLNRRRQRSARHLI